MFCLCGCSQKEPSVVRTYEKTDSKEAFENTEPVIMVKHYEMSDGTWKTDDYTYQYRLEITGRMNNAEKDSTFIFLSNIDVSILLTHSHLIIILIKSVITCTI